MTREEVASQGDGQNGRPALLIVNGEVLDVTDFADAHPGGYQILMDWVGKDATKIFYDLHRHEVLETRLKRLKKANLAGYDAKLAPRGWTQLSRVPYAEIDMDGSPFFNDSHKRFRLECRKFLWESGVVAWADKAENTGEKPPMSLYQKLGKSGYLALTMGPGPHLKRIPEPNLWSQAGMKAEDVDMLHTSLLGEERTRICCPGAEDGISSGIAIGLGPVMRFGAEWMQGETVQSILEGRKIICLAITEPFVGSDVAGVRTTATLSADGTHYIVSGTKKWITNAVFADYFTTLVRTDPNAKGSKGLSMLLIEKGPGVVVRKIPTDYSLAAGTGLISFENVKVPVKNVLGKPGMGMMITMHNFNLERLGICTMALGRSRRIIEETFKWAQQRKAFGKSLLQQPVIRQHMGKMVAEHQAAYSAYLILTHKYMNTPHKLQGALGGPTALLKYRTTRATTLISDLAVQVFGGRGVTKTGMGKNISRVQKSFKLASVYGGSEEIMLDLGVRQAMKFLPKNAKL